MSKPKIKKGQVYIHEKGDQLTVLKVEGEKIYLQNNDGSTRTTMVFTLMNHYRLKQ